LDLQVMRRAAAFFCGRHDFQSFAANPGYAKESTVRTVSRCEVTRRARLLTFVIEGDGFLYRMCRGIVGTLVQVGLGKFEAGAIQSMLAKRDRRVAGMSAPARGLVLWRVFYPKGPKAVANLRRDAHRTART
jgi:tRNA pseudouridine38-40 synthase